MTVGERIKAARKKKHLTQAILAERMNVSGAMIAQYEKGVRNPKYETIQKFADALGVEVVDLLSPEDTTFDKDDRSAAIAAAKSIAKYHPSYEVSSPEDWLITLGDEVFSQDLDALHEYADRLNHKGFLLLIDYAKALAAVPDLQESPGKYIGGTMKGELYDG